MFLSNRSALKSFGLLYTENPTPTPTPTPKTFTQDEVNTLMANNRRTLQQQNQTLATQLEEIKTNTSLTQQERDALQVRIDELTTQHQSTEEKLKGDLAKTQKQAEEKYKAVEAERDQWKNQYESETIVRSITDAAVVAEAFAPEQLVALLKPNTRFAEEKDAAGKVINRTPRVKMEVKEGDKTVQKDLTIVEAIGQLKAQRDRFGNLFKSGAAGGVGGQGNQNQPSDADVSKMSSEEYRVWRKTNPATKK